MRLINLGRIALCVLVISCLPFVAAVAEDEPDGTWKAPPIGTKATYNFGASWEVVAVRDGRVFLLGDRSTSMQNVTWHRYRGMLASISDDGWKRTVDEGAVDKLFPLKVGNKTTVSAPQGDWNFRVMLKVTAIRTIDTLIGPRKVFRIAFLERGDDNHRAKGFGYYDAELGIYHGGIYIYGDNEPYRWKLLILEVPE